GILLLEKIRELRSDVMVIFLTGYPDFEYAQKALRYGAFDYLLKPMRAKDIVEVIQKAEGRIEHLHALKRERDQHHHTIRLNEQWKFEKDMRELIYGTRLDPLEGSALFGASRLLSAVSVLCDFTGDDAEGQLELLVESLQNPTMILKDGRCDWVILLGWANESQA